MSAAKKYTDLRYPRSVSEAVSKSMRSNKGRNTKPELLFRKALWNNGLRGYRLHWKKVPGRPDIAFPGKNLAIFVNGCYWHRCPHCKLSTPKTNSEFWQAKFDANVERDRKKQQALLDLDWKFLVIWECRLKADIESCVEEVKRALNEH